MQEILTVLVSGGILESNGEADKFLLPEAHKEALLCKDLGFSCWSSAAPRLFASYSEVLECCKDSGPKGLSVQTHTMRAKRNFHGLLVTGPGAGFFFFLGGGALPKIFL